MKRIADFIDTYRINRRAGCGVRQSVRYAWAWRITVARSKETS